LDNESLKSLRRSGSAARFATDVVARSISKGVDSKSVSLQSLKNMAKDVVDSSGRVVK